MARTVSGCTCRTGGSSSKAASVRRQQEFAPCDRAVFEESDFKLAGVGNWCRIVEDAEASGGKALKLFATDYQWCVQLAVPYGAFDPGVRYRVRAKFEKKPDAPDVNVVNADPGVLLALVRHLRPEERRRQPRDRRAVRGSAGDLAMRAPTPLRLHPRQRVEACAFAALRVRF